MSTSLPAPLEAATAALVLPSYSTRKEDSILHWVQKYWETKVEGSPAGTIRGKRDDLQLFLSFLSAVVASDHVDDWTPSHSKSLKSWLQKSDPKPVRKHMKAYAPSSVNRMLATLRHFAKFIQDSRKFEAGFPFDGVKDISLKEPERNGLPDISVMRLRAALDQVTKFSTRQDQRPKRNRACFMLILATGLRTFEVEGLRSEQYQSKYLKNVKGKSENYHDVYVSANARRELNDYIAQERGTDPGPLFKTVTGGRLSRQQMDRFCRKVASHANSKLPPEEQIHLHSHKLRHTSVKKVHDDKEPLAAKKFSRHRSFQQMERYAKQMRAEHEEMVDNLYS